MPHSGRIFCTFFLGLFVSFLTIVGLIHGVSEAVGKINDIRLLRRDLVLQELRDHVDKELLVNKTFKRSLNSSGMQDVDNHLSKRADRSVFITSFASAVTSSKEIPNTHLQLSNRSVEYPKGMKSVAKKLEDKIAEWRTRDSFFLQRGALSSLLGNKCVDSGRGNFPGQSLRMWSCATGAVRPNQKFLFSESGMLYQPTRSKTNKVMCLEARSNETVRIVSDCNGDQPEQIWEFQRLQTRHKTFGFLRNVALGTCLTKPPTGRNTSHLKTVRISLETCNNGCNQAWSFGERPVDQHNWSVWKPSKQSAGRILCWILTFPAASDTKALAVNNTWGRKCDHLLYMTTKHVDGFNTVKLDLWGPEGRNMLWTKSKLSWLYVHKYYLNKADWFVKADDDTYLVMDNLHDYLSRFDTNLPLHFGRLFKAGKNKYYSGGSGIILSKEALRRLGATFRDAEDEKWAGDPRGTGPEDLLTSKSLEPLGVHVQESLDKKGRHLFMPMGLDHEYFAPKRDESSWFYKYSKTAREGPDCCSERWIASHYTKTPQMYALDILEDMKCKMPMREWPHLRVHD